MLSITSLCKTLPGTTGQAPRRLLDGLNFSISAGELVALVGESGSGKTTLLNLIARLDRPDSGRICLDDTEITCLDDDAGARLRRQRFGFVFQAFHILPHLTAGQNVALPLWLLGLGDAESACRARDALADLGMGDLADRWPRELSGGELQRVAVARALVHRPRIVLADEPTGSLDPDNAERVLALLADAVRTAGAVGLLVTHSRAAAGFADRALRLKRDGTVEPISS